MMTSVVLALNRCLVVTRRSLARLLFEGHRTYFWLLAPATVACLQYLFFKPQMYNGVIFAYVNDPHLGYYNDYGVRVCRCVTLLFWIAILTIPLQYVNRLLLLLNIFAAVSLPVIYGLFIAILTTMSGSLKRLTMHKEYNVGNPIRECF